MNTTQVRKQLNKQFELGLEQATGFKFQEVVLARDSFSVMGTQEAIDAVEALDLPTFDKEYDEEYDAWFISVRVLKDEVTEQQPKVEEAEVVEAIAPTTQKSFSKVAAQVKKSYKTVREDSQVIVFEAGEKLFAMSEGCDSITVYQCYQDTHDIVFLPGCKTGKSFKTVSSFVSARTAA
jgi:hypothetical protein